MSEKRRPAILAWLLNGIDLHLVIVGLGCSVMVFLFALAKELDGLPTDSIAITGPAFLAVVLLCFIASGLPFRDGPRAMLQHAVPNLLIAVACVIGVCAAISVITG